ncbi:MAG: HPr family phosphocarrier protein [Elusimicrobiaceae bacterium]|nr:HPr family phosphocarrier protein [Elusimicrobiaceae bacterium]
MVTHNLKITNQLGLHARPAALIAQTAGSFVSAMSLSKDDVSVDAKSIMGVMMLAAEYGSTLTLIAEGPDEKEAAAAIKQLFENKFNEDF